MLARGLRRLGYHILEFASAEEFLSYLREDGHIDLLLSDVDLGGMPGTHLRECMPSRIPTVLMSGSGGPHVDILKPFPIAQLKELLERTLMPA